MTISSSNLKDMLPNQNEYKAVSKMNTNTRNVDKLKIRITRKQAEILCEKLEEILYDEPTYRELDRQCIALMNENEELLEELEQYRELEEERSACMKYRRLV